jgi:hypothetical protein
LVYWPQVEQRVSVFAPEVGFGQPNLSPAWPSEAFGSVTMKAMARVRYAVSARSVISVRAGRRGSDRRVLRTGRRIRCQRTPAHIGDLLAARRRSGVKGYGCNDIAAYAALANMVAGSTPIVGDNSGGRRSVDDGDSPNSDL